MIEETPSEQKEAEHKAWLHRTVFHHERASELWKRYRAQPLAETAAYVVARYSQEVELAVISHIAAQTIQDRPDLAEIVSDAYWASILAQGKERESESV